MGVDTKAIIRRGVTLDELVRHTLKKYKNVSVRSTHSEDFLYIEFDVNPEEKRSMGVFLDPKMAERDYGINGILLSIGCWGSSTEIAYHFAGEFGGFVDENDCDDIDFQAVNIQKLEEAKDFSAFDKFKLKVIKEFGYDKVNSLLKLCEEFKNL
jgi:hypothetical protein